MLYIRSIRTRPDHGFKERKVIRDLGGTVNVAFPWTNPSNLTTCSISSLTIFNR